ncbi:MAG TPA: hypothetical protein VN714_18060 [Trebonia sp.]|nr:hypothetical protein [Trebonia sp.]
MPELEIVGRVENPETIEVDPIILPVCAYTLEREEVIERFPFKPIMPLGIAALMERVAGQEIPVNTVLVCLRDCLIADAVERWETFLGREDLLIDAETISRGWAALLGAYGRRPTLRSPGSSRTGRRSGRTSKAAAASAA